MRIRRWVVVVGLCLATVTTLVALSAVALMDEAPVWWRTIDAKSDRAHEAARAIENSISSRMHRVRPADPAHSVGATGVWRSEVWTISLRAADINAWLNTRMPTWLAKLDESVRWPERFEQLQVHFGDRRVHVGVRVSLDSHKRIFSVALDPRVTSEGRMWLNPGWVHVGRLAMPTSWVVGEVVSDAGGVMSDGLGDAPEIRRVLSALRGRSPVAEDAVIRLGDGRRVRILKITPRVGGRVEITCRTEREGELASVHPPPESG